MADRIPVAVIGVGYLGRFHAQKYRALPDCELIGVVDTDGARAEAVGAEVNAPAFTDAVDVLGRARAVSVAVPTADHRAVVRQCLEAGVHVLVEKPIAASRTEAEELVQLARARGLALQVGYLERFNPAFAAVRPRVSGARFIEAIRIASFKERGLDVDVVLDLMSHDLDLVLTLVKAPVKDLHAVGVSVLTAHTDLANARIVFADGCVANLTASRISTKSERKLRIFQPDAYFSLDLAEPSVRIYTTQPGRDGAVSPNFRQEAPPLESADALLAEIEAFLEAVRLGKPPAVPGGAALEVMALAERIAAEIERNRSP